MKIILAAALCLGGLAAGAAPQTSTPTPAQPPAYKATGEEVLLDVVVRDKKGRFVNDLKPENFEVFDNGEKRAIKSLRLVEGSEAVTSAGARSQLDPLRQIRLLTLIFEGLDQDGRRLSRDAGMSLLKSELGPNVYMSIMVIDHKLEVIQPFTNDRDLLKKAIARATGGANDFTADNLQVRAELEQMLGPNQSGAQSLADRAAAMSNGATAASGPGAAPNGSATANAVMAQMMLKIVNSNQEDVATDAGRAIIYSLLNAVKEQYLLPGRKTILLFSPGFSVPQGMEEPFRMVISVANRSNVSFYAIDSRGLTIAGLNANSVDQLANAAAGSKANSTSNGGGVTVDMAQSVDRSIDSQRANTQDTLGQLARDTGGALIANTNDFKGPLRKLDEDIQTYYEISYNPGIQNYDGAFRKVSVKTDEADLRVQSRSGYFALPPSMTASGQVIAAYEVPLLKALDEKPVPHSFGYESTGMHFRGDTGAPTCDVVIDIPLGNLTLTEDKGSQVYQGSLAYVALLKDGKGQIVKKFRSEVPVKIGADQIEAFKANSHFVSAENFDVPPGRYILETAVLDGAGQKISARKSVFIVPGQSSSLGMSSVAVVRDTKAKGPATAANDPLLMADKVITPTVSPTIKKSVRQGVPFFVIVYPDKAVSAKPTLKMVFSRDGQVLGSGSVPLGDPDAHGRIQYVATAPLASLAPGDYQVQFVAQQGTETAIESTTFTLEQ